MASYYFQGTDERNPPGSGLFFLPCKGWCTNCGRSHRAHGWQVCYPSHGRAFDSMLVSSICSNQNNKDRIEFLITNHESQLEGSLLGRFFLAKWNCFWCLFLDVESFRLKMPDQSTAFCGTVFSFRSIEVLDSLWFSE